MSQEGQGGEGGVAETEIGQGRADASGQESDRGPKGECGEVDRCIREVEEALAHWYYQKAGHHRYQGDHYGREGDVARLQAIRHE